jgi:uncharacterized protein
VGLQTMKIGIISDTHDQMAMTRKAMDFFIIEDVDFLLHCGDMTTAETARLMALPTHAVIGNNDWDEPGISMAIQNTGGSWNSLCGQMEIEGVKIAWTHGHNNRILRDLCHSGRWSYVFHGHTHQKREEKIDETWVVNPGALQRVQIASVGILELPQRIFSFHKIAKG